ncbi:MAG: hypothetical protein U0325_30745 [Polyangiales bacterium]
MSLSPRARRASQLALGAVGVTAALAMLRHTDVNALRRFGGFALLAGGIEGARIGCEALATRSIHGPAVRVPWGPLLRAHAVGYALAMTLPAGRGVAEATKAALLSPWTGAARGGGVALTNQSLVFLSTGSVALLGGAAALSLGARNLGAAAGTQGLALLAMGLGLLAVVRSRALAARVSGWFPRAAVWLHGVHEGARLAGVPRAWAAFVMHRTVQAVQLLLLLGALGRWEPRTALALTGAAIVGVTLGTALPGQLGAIGAALALAGPGVGVPAPTALAMSLVLHAGQFAWAAVGIALWALTRGGQR